MNKQIYRYITATVEPGAPYIDENVDWSVRSANSWESRCPSDDIG